MTTTDRAQWLEERRQGIGASDAPALVGLSRFASAYSIWADKVYGDDGDASDEPNEAAKWGRKLEPIVAAEFETRTGLRVTSRQLDVIHPEHAWMRCTLDGLVRDAATNLIVGVYEGKTASVYARDWGDVAAGDMPPAVIVQCQHAMAVASQDVTHVAVLIGGQEFRHGAVERDEPMICDLIDLEAKFWSMVETGVYDESLFPIDGSPATSAAVERLTRTATGGEIEVGDAGAEAVERYREASALGKIADESKDRARNELALMLGECEVGLVDGKTVVTYRPSSGKGRVDLAALEQAHPQIVAAYRYQSTARTLRVTPSRGRT